MIQRGRGYQHAGYSQHYWVKHPEVGLEHARTHSRLGPTRVERQAHQTSMDVLVVDADAPRRHGVPHEPCPARALLADRNSVLGPKVELEVVALVSGGVVTTAVTCATTGACNTARHHRAEATVTANLKPASDPEPRTVSVTV